MFVVNDNARILACEGTLGAITLAVNDRQQRIFGAAGAGNDALERGLPLIDEVLRQAGLALGELDGLACSVGPGAFTSLRISLSFMKGLAFAAKLPLVAVSTFDVLHAWSATAIAENMPYALFLQPRSGIFSARYGVAGGTVLCESSGPTADVVTAVLAAGAQPSASATIVWPPTAADTLVAAGWSAQPLELRAQSAAAVLLEIAHDRLAQTPRDPTALHAIRAEYGEPPATTTGPA